MTCFEKAISSDIKKITKDLIIHLECLLHFSQIIIKKSAKAGKFKKN